MRPPSLADTVAELKQICARLQAIAARLDAPDPPVAPEPPAMHPARRGLAPDLLPSHRAVLITGVTHAERLAMAEYLGGEFGPAAICDEQSRVWTDYEWVWAESPEKAAALLRAAVEDARGCRLLVIAPAHERVSHRPAGFDAVIRMGVEYGSPDRTTWYVFGVARNGDTTQIDHGDLDP
jgi:hypothetical protein